MDFSCRVLYNSSWLIRGRHVHYAFTYGGIYILQFPFYCFPNIHWSFFVLLCILIIQYKTSWFSITLSQEQITIQKRIFGISYFKHTFHFKSLDYLDPPGTFKFRTAAQTLDLQYEEFEFDEFGYSINSKYKSLGSYENSNMIFKALKEWVNSIYQITSNKGISIQNQVINAKRNNVQ